MPRKKKRKKPVRRYQRTKNGYSTTPLRHEEELTAKREQAERERVINELREARKNHD